MVGSGGRQELRNTEASINEEIKTIEISPDTAGLKLTADKTEAVLISSRKKVETGWILVSSTEK